ncbi:conserved hypothetical protein [Verrucomicrobia bacterium]|nr:conserved hypothetical protein [Verrucomicrobiota bacterium]
MKNTLVVVADLGCFKAYKLENNQPNRSPHLELVEVFDNPEAHGRIGDKVSDLGGRFPRGARNDGGSVMSDGERHNIELEMRRRFVRQLARRLNALAQGAEAERWLLAASKEINHQLIEELDPQIRAKIEKNVPANLTKLEQAEILRHF